MLILRKKNLVKIFELLFINFLKGEYLIGEQWFLVIWNGIRGGREFLLDFVDSVEDGILSKLLYEIKQN